MSADFEAFVIGAGPAGLTAAYCLTAANRSVAVIERDPVYVGGISRTVRYKDFMFDIGGHRFFSKAREVVALWHEILPDDLIERPRMSRIFYDGKFFSYALNAFEALANLGILRSAACMISFAYAKVFPIQNVRSFHDWIRNQFGERLFSIFFQTYTEKVWGMSCDEISADWAAQRIKGLDLGLPCSTEKRALKLDGAPEEPARLSSRPSSRASNIHGKVPNDVEAARGIRVRGGKVLMGRELQALAYDSNKNLAGAGVGRRRDLRDLTARHVISSAPIRRADAKMSPRPISYLHARELRYRDFITVALVVSRPDLFPDNWIYVHDPAVKVGRVQNFGSWSPEMVPPA
jgi:protoporphyrinogen oxidase